MTSSLRAGTAALVVIACLLASSVAAGPATPAPDADGPVVSGPVVGGKGEPFVLSTSFDVRPFGYHEHEYFVAGQAASYHATAPLGEDGRWEAARGATAPYLTRIVVRRPAEASNFNGTVVVEWLNVSGALDAAPDWTYLHTTLMREGYAWVGVSAQQIGVEGPASAFPEDGGGPLKLHDPARYGTLRHPGDDYSYDIFTQVASVLRRPAGANILGSLEPRRLLAVGESQSALRLTTYINAVQPLEHAFDGFLVHSRAIGSSPLGPDDAIPRVVRTRTDSDVPVMTFETETDLVGLRYLEARQPDSKNFRLWEVAGTAHADVYLLDVGRTDDGLAAKETTYLPSMMSIANGLVPCARPVNSGPQQFVLGAALTALDRWVRRGTPPTFAPRIETDRSGAIVRDERGNARGGVRTAAVDAPVAALAGLDEPGRSLCGLFGTTIELHQSTLAALYPDHRAYVHAVDRATRRAVRDGFVQRADAVSIHRAAWRSDIGR